MIRKESYIAETVRQCVENRQQFGAYPDKEKVIQLITQVAEIAMIEAIECAIYKTERDFRWRKTKWGKSFDCLISPSEAHNAP